MSDKSGTMLPIEAIQQHYLRPLMARIEVLEADTKRISELEKQNETLRRQVNKIISNLRLQGINLVDGA